MTTYGYSISWTEWGKGVQTVSVSGYTTPEQAYEHIIAAARDSGWTYPRWWEFWRWNDSRPKPPCE